MNGKNLLTLFLCALILTLGACGQSGPLYLPEPAQDVPATDDQEDNNEETPGT